MHFANRMEAFGTGIFSVLLQKKQEKEAQGVSVIDLSVGTRLHSPHALEAELGFSYGIPLKKRP